VHFGADEPPLPLPSEPEAPAGAPELPDVPGRRELSEAQTVTTTTEVPQSGSADGPSAAATPVAPASSSVVAADILLLIRGSRGVEAEPGGEQVLHGDEPAAVVVEHGPGQLASLPAAPDRRTAHAACGGGFALGQQGATGAHDSVSSLAAVSPGRPTHSPRLRQAVDSLAEG
jgi:hypothetical protein